MTPDSLSNDSIQQEYPDGAFLPAIDMRDATFAPFEAPAWSEDQIEAARAAAWAKTRELCQNPYTDMCLGDSDAITFAVLRAVRPA